MFALADLQQGVFLSPDDGSPWMFAGLKGIWGRSLATIDTNVFAGTSSGVFLYTGSDTTWMPRNNGLPSSIVYSLRSVDSVLFAGLSDGVYRSADLGNTWTPVSQNSIGKSVFAIAEGRQDLFAGAENGLWRHSLSTLVTSTPKEEPPVMFGLSQNYPNPFNPTTSFEFRVGSLAFVRLSVYDVLGREVARLVNEEKLPGSYVVTWNASLLPSGVYYYQMTAGHYAETKTMVLIR